MVRSWGDNNAVHWEVLAGQRPCEAVDESYN
jgi:hypothetical protein